MAGVIGRAGAQEAVATWRRLKAERPADYGFAEPQLNALGRVLAQEKRVDDAITMLELNLEAYPNSFITYDNLGDVLLIRGDTALAIGNFEKSVALNSANQSVVEKLKRLRTP
jgi:predicted negative regulator of RcsB-dependent stress response